MSLNIVAKVLRTQRAVGLVELALVLPFLIIVFGAGIEFSRSMSIYSRLNMLARELTRAAFSECAQRVSPDTVVVADVDVCLNEAVNETIGVTGAILNGTNFVLSVFKWDTAYTLPGSHVPPYKNTRLIARYPNPTPFVSNFNEMTFQPGPPQTEPQAPKNLLLQNHRVLVYGEVQYQYHPILPFISRLFGFGDDKTFYVATSF